MSLLKHTNDLSKGVSVHIKNQVNRDDIVPKTQSVTFTRNLRVDNHITNQVAALLDLGVADKPMTASIEPSSSSFCRILPSFAPRKSTP